MIDGESEKEIKLRQSNQGDQEIEIDLMDILRKIIGIRKKIYKAAGIGLIIGIIIAISIRYFLIKLAIEATIIPNELNVVA